MRAEYNTNCQLVYALFYFCIDFSTKMALMWPLPLKIIDEFLHFQIK